VKEYLQEYGKGAAKALGGASALALLGWLGLAVPKLRQQAMRLSLSDKQISSIRWWFLGVAITCVVAAISVLLFRTHRKLRATQDEFRDYQVSLQQERQERQAAEHQAIFKSQLATPQRPSDLAFEILKWFNTFGPYGAVDIGTIANVRGISREQAITAMKELRDAQHIRTAVPGAGEWNGQYAITASGRECVQKFAT
jgi:hypothetical protein